MFQFYRKDTNNESTHKTENWDIKFKIINTEKKNFHN